MVSPIGQSVDEYDQALRIGRHGFTRASFDGGEGLNRLDLAVAKVDDFDDVSQFSIKKLPFLDRAAQFAIVACRQALAESGLEITPENRDRIDVVLGTSFGSGASVEENYLRLFGQRRRPHPLLVPKGMMNSMVAQVSMDCGARGRSFAIASACASASHAMGQSYELVAYGLADAVITGGFEASLTEGVLRGWDGLKVMAPDVCRPFSRGRLGLILAEGGAAFVLEDFAAAQARGARILAEVLGYGATSDAGDIMTPSLHGPVGAMQRCLASSGLSPEDVDYINAHGTGTAINDKCETDAIKEVFGNAARDIAISSTKSMHGHALGGAGALEALAVLCSINGSYIPPTMNYQESDPECDLDYTPNRVRQRKVRAALSNSFAFGGHNAVLAFGGI